MNGETGKILLVAKENETWEHLSLKLAMALLLWEYHPVPEPGANHPALLGQEFRPDLLGTDVAGNVSLWAECGKTALHKISKLAKRYRDARIVFLKARPREARKLRQDLIEQEVSRQERLEIWSFQEGDYAVWEALLDERTDVTGEVSGRELNLVVNNQIFLAGLGSF